jgi:hypothetical protein
MAKNTQKKYLPLNEGFPTILRPSPKISKIFI